MWNENPTYFPFFTFLFFFAQAQLQKILGFVSKITDGDTFTSLLHHQKNKNQINLALMHQKLET